MKQFAALAVVLALAGCTKTVDEMSYSEVKEYAAQLHKKCLAQGVKDGPEMQLCINQEARADQSRRIKQRQIAAALSAAGDDIEAGMSAPRTIDCTSTPQRGWVGGPVSSVRTTCY